MAGFCSISVPVLLFNWTEELRLFFIILKRPFRSALKVPVRCFLLMLRMHAAAVMLLRFYAKYFMFLCLHGLPDQTVTRLIYNWDARYYNMITIILMPPCNNNSIVCIAPLCSRQK
jgi:hypothetical protein